MRIPQRFLVLLLLTATTFPAFGEGHDWEWWTWWDITVDTKHFGLDNGDKLVFRHEYQRDMDFDRNFYTSYEAGYRIKVPGFEEWSLTPIFGKFDNSPGDDEYRYYANLDRTWKKLGGTDWDLATRIRFELRDRDGRDDILYRLRPRAILSHPLPCHFRENPLRWYTLYETFYDFEVDKWNGHRFGSGFKFKYNDKISFTLGYQLEMLDRTRQANRWDYDSQLMTLIGIDF